MDDFEERAGAGASATSFGRWLQTLDEVRPKMEVNIKGGRKGLTEPIECLVFSSLHPSSESTHSRLALST